MIVGINVLKQYCKDYTKIENYEEAINDKVQIWHCHHRLETHFSDGTLRPRNARLLMKELKALDMYYNRPPEELIFMKQVEHLKLHSKGNSSNKGKKLPEETKRKMSKAHRGKKRPPLSKEWKQNMSKAMKGRPAWNKGKTGIYSEEVMRKRSEKRKGRKWYNNGIINIISFECPAGFTQGRLK